MASISGSGKKSGSKRTADAGDKDRHTAESKDRISAVKNELRPRYEGDNSPVAGHEQVKGTLLEGEEWIRILADDAPVLIWANGSDGSEFVNRAYLEFLGVDGLGDIRHFNWARYVHPDDREAYTNAYLDCFRRGAPFNAVFRFLRHDGEYRWMKSVGRPVFTGAGVFQGYVGSSQDITEQIMMEDELRRSKDSLEKIVEHRTAELQASEAKFRAIFEGAGVAIFVADVATGRIIDCNGKAEELTGRPRRDIIGLHQTQLHPVDKADVQREQFERHARGVVFNNDEALVQHRDGRAIPVIVNAAPLKIDGRDLLIESFLNITERKKAEEALKGSEEKYRDLVENANSIIIRWDVHGNLTFFNEYAEKLFGYSKDEVLGRNVVGTIVPPAESTGRNLDALMEDVERHPEYYEVNVNENMRKNGERIWIAWTNKAILDKSGKTVEILSVGNDITERKRAEEALLDSQAHLNSIFRAAPTGIGVVVDRVITEANDRLCEMTGYKREELLGKSARIFYPTDKDYEYVGREKYSQIEQLGTGTVETKWRRRDGSIIDVVLSSTPLNPDDLRAGVTFTALDITKRMQAEKALARDRYILTKSQEVAHLGNWAWNLETGEFTGSAECYRIYGYGPGDAKPTREWVLSRVLPEDRTVMADFMDSRAKDGMRGAIDFRIRRPDDSVVYVNTIVDKSVRDKKGKITKLYGISQDVTEHKRVEEQLKNAKAQAELYLDLMGHDINNMHQVALGYLELAKELPAGADQAEFLDKPMEVLQRSTALIRNVRKLQKLQDGVFKIEDIDLSQLLHDVWKEYGSVPHKRITLKLNGLVHCTVRANELLHDVFANLVINAIKHTGDKADILLVLDTVMDDDKRCCMVIVEDNGPGIPDVAKEHIFNRTLKDTKNAHGTGLGLYLVKSLVESFGGKVWAEDRVQGDHTKGARFVVTLPTVEK